MVSCRFGFVEDLAGLEIWLGWRFQWVGLHCNGCEICLDFSGVGGFGFICNSIIGWILGWPGLDLCLVWGIDRQWLGWRFGWIADLAGLGCTLVGLEICLGWRFGFVRFGLGLG